MVHIFTKSYCFWFVVASQSLTVLIREDQKKASLKSKGHLLTSLSSSPDKGQEGQLPLAVKSAVIKATEMNGMK